MKCEFCSGETGEKRVKKQHWFKKKLYIIENVEAQVCRQCGERYFSAQTLDSIDALISGKHDIKAVLAVEVLSA